jgi:hypothetical protein
MAVRAALLALAILATGCPSDPIFGPPTETECPPGGSTLTYANFGQPFMASYCTRCHSSELVGAQRKGAPSFHDFDSLFGVKAVSMHVDETTASGPASTNKGMPPDGAKPTLEERKQLGEWIACGMP